ncbi:DNA repair protein RAD51 homolog 4 isoform X3 [Malania oleifera]|uniref:DNA repair protein RAD51 homolog 4 isoform X3 n=1 Tax=Malania oleifera TaxID=397392 RepID=UPI0025AE3FE1|nr:DNA repair protein RAD51 homolog 4 isoform X3 [Malania oleifera]
MAFSRMMNLDLVSAPIILVLQEFFSNNMPEVALMEQQSTSERLKQGITQVLSIIDGLHRPWSNGMELFEDTQRNKIVLSTGCEGYLESELSLIAFDVGHVTELVGPSSSGKTQVCLQAASTVAKDYVGGVAFLDTGNSFSAKRVACLIGQTLDLDPDLKEAKHKIVQKVMSGILCYSVFDIFAMLDVLHQLESNLKCRAGDNELHLLIIDSISSLITTVLGGSGPHGHALMVSAGYLLKKLAHEHNISVVVTNHMVGGEGGVLKPALGESWKCIPHVRLLLSPDRASNICNISLLKHPYIIYCEAGVSPVASSYGNQYLSFYLVTYLCYFHFLRHLVKQRD